MDNLASIVRRGHKVPCPGCGQRFMSQAYNPLHQSGIGQHIKATHPELFDEVVKASRAAESAIRSAAAAEAKERTQRPHRMHTVSGAFLDEIAAEVRSLLDMMEPYYAQSNAPDSGYALLDRLEEIAASSLPLSDSLTNGGSSNV